MLASCLLIHHIGTFSELNNFCYLQINVFAKNCDEAFLLYYFVYSIFILSVYPSLFNLKNIHIMTRNSVFS